MKFFLLKSTSYMLIMHVESLLRKTVWFRFSLCAMLLGAQLAVALPRYTKPINTYEGVSYQDYFSIASAMDSINVSQDAFQECVKSVSAYITPRECRGQMFRYVPGTETPVDFYVEELAAIAYWTNNFFGPGEYRFQDYIVIDKRRFRKRSFCPAPYVPISKEYREGQSVYRYVEKCELPPRPENNCTVEGNPVNFLSGDKVEDVTDYASFDGLVLHRKYLSQRRGWVVAPTPRLSDLRVPIVNKTTAACLGESVAISLNRWPDVPGPYVPVPFATCLEEWSPPATLIVQTADGFSVEYIQLNTELFLSPNGKSRIKIIDPDQNNGWAYHLESNNGIHQYFNLAGELVYEDSPAAQLSYNYANGRLLSILNDKGKSIVFGYEQDQIVSAKMAEGIVTYQYKKVGGNQYLVAGAISEVHLLDGTTEYYKYENTKFPLALTTSGIVGKGDFGHWQYDNDGRAIESIHPSGADKFTFDYSQLTSSDPKVTVTNSLNKKTTYHVGEINGALRVVRVEGEPSQNCASANQFYDYYPSGQVKIQTDWSGNKTYFTYDNQNRESTRTKAFGTADATSVHTCWDVNLSQPSRIIEPTKITLFDYTATGQLKSQTVKPRPAGAVDCSTAL